MCRGAVSNWNGLGLRLTALGVERHATIILIPKLMIIQP